jgi:beta-D-xylosidase 4
MRYYSTITLLICLSFSSFALALAFPPTSSPRPALVWECDAARSQFQSWTQPSAVNGTISLNQNASLTLTVLGWPLFSFNTPLVSVSIIENATWFSFNAVSGALVTMTASAQLPAGACVAPLYGVPFHGAGITTVACIKNGAPSQSWKYNADDGTLRLVANNSLCLDFGSTFSCATDGSNLTYCDASATPAVRAADLAGRLSAEEASALLSSNMIVQPMNYGTNLGLPARGVPPLWFSECCHGAVSLCGDIGDQGGSGCPSSFPAGLSTGASLNVSSWTAMGRFVSTEARALYNQGLHGLGCFAPNVNPFRAPQWGRGAEVQSEDPHINGEFGAAFASALQGEGDASVLRVLATLKHGTAYDMENSDGENRGSFNAVVSDRDLAEYFWPPFKATAQRAKPRFMMASYNSVNGVPSCASDLFMNNVLRGDWGYTGATVTDCGGLAQIQTAHHYTNTTDATIAIALASGLDSECGNYFTQYGAAAVSSGAVSLSALQLAATRALTSWFSAGFMPSLVGEGADPYASLNGNDVDTTESRALALDMAIQGAALLRNVPVVATGRPLLPLSSLLFRNIALIGPHVNSTRALLGPYSAPANTVMLNNSLAAAFARYASINGLSLNVQSGCSDTSCASTAGFALALAAASAADVIIVAFGLSGSDEGEGHDRKTLILPGNQEALLSALAALGKPIVLVLIHGGPIGLVAAADTTAFPAILTLHYPGQAGGEAAVRLLFGLDSPSGRTLVTWYPPEFNAARPVIDMQLQPHVNSSGAHLPGITYKWYDGPVLFPFGTGGSYTTFSFFWCDAFILKHEVVTSALIVKNATPPSYCVNVTNTGNVTSDVSVLAFLSSGQPDEPLEEVFDFGRLHALEVGETRELHFTMSLDVLASGRVPQMIPMRRSGALYIYPGNYSIRIGDTMLSGNFVTTKLLVTGEVVRWA